MCHIPIIYKMFPVVFPYMAYMFPQKNIVSHMCVQYVPNLLQYVANIFLIW